MSYLAPSEFVTKMVDAGEAKVFMSTRDTLIRAYMAGAILALAAWFAVTVTVSTGFRWDSASCICSVSTC
jgi:formate transporter